MNQDNKYALRRIKYQGTYMINICDLDLVGKVINKGDFTINISREYFQDEEIAEEEAASLLNSPLFAPASKILLEFVFLI